MTHFRAEMKVFNMKRVPEDQTQTESVDLLIWGVGEIAIGSMRIDDDELIGAYRTSTTRRRTTGTPTSGSTGRVAQGKSPGTKI